MKKPLITLATIAFSSSTFAKDSVALYGSISYYYAYNKEASDKSQKNNDPFLQKGSLRIGIKGKESITDKTNLTFKFERNFDATTGKSRASRQTYIGLKNENFGSLYLGRKDSLSSEHVAGFDPSFSGGKYISSGIRSYSRLNKSITYFSPTFSGVMVGVQFAKQDAKQGFNNSYNSSITVQYESDFGLEIGLTGTSDLSSKKTTDNNKETTKFFGDALIQLAAAYDFNIAKISAQLGYDIKFENSKKINLEHPLTTEIAVSTKINDKAAVAAYVGYGYRKQSLHTGFSGQYDFSKRTYLFGGLGFATNKNDNNKYENNYELNLGIAHTF